MRLKKNQWRKWTILYNQALKLYSFILDHLAAVWQHNINLLSPYSASKPYSVYQAISCLFTHREPLTLIGVMFPPQMWGAETDNENQAPHINCLVVHHSGRQLAQPLHASRKCSVMLAHRSTQVSSAHSCKHGDVKEEWLETSCHWNCEITPNKSASTFLVCG